MNYKTFNVTDFIIGNGTIDNLKELISGKVALFIDGRVIEATNLKEKLYGELLKNVDYKLICDIRCEPSIENLDDSIAVINEYNPDYFLAIGGGTVIDSAKALRLFYERPDLTWEKSFDVMLNKDFVGKSKLISIPTTSGTGSETTSVSIVKDLKKIKRVILTKCIKSDIAILDFDLVQALPASVAAFSGLDALSHSMDAGILDSGNLMVENLAVKTVSMIFDYLSISVNGDKTDQKTIDAKNNMHIASAFAGMCISNSGCSLSHGLNQPGDYFNLPHGMVVGILLPYCVKYTGYTTFYEKVADALAITGNKEEKIDKLVAKIFELNRSVNMPTSFKEANVDEKEYFKYLDEYIELALNNYTVLTSPKVPTRGEVKELFTKVYYGNI